MLWIEKPVVPDHDSLIVNGIRPPGCPDRLPNCGEKGPTPHKP
ncbi:MAG: hypothetical protein PHQ23_11020 [Candidatus Wallbacteria bacterium]|nr:hypothetical protein [Candidatus Wallbacteria bacterium]